MRNRQRLWILLLFALAILGTLLRNRGDFFGLIALVGIHGGMLMGAWVLGRRLTEEDDGLAITIVRTLQIYFLSMVAIGLALGLLGLLQPWGLVLACGGTAFALSIGRRLPPIQLNMDPTAHLWNVLTLILIAIVGIKSLADPEYVYDSMSEHLLYPATWVQQGRITRVSTWCGGVVTDYAPCSTETYYATLMLPLGTDVAARAGQFPFWVLLVAGVSALGKALGLHERTRSIITAAVAILPGPAMQAATAMLDVALAAHLICVVMFAVKLSRSKATNDAVSCLLSMGLLVGTKFLAMTMLIAALPMVVLGFWKWWQGHQRRIGGMKLGVALAIALCVGLPWHLWNMIETGNPIYPVELKMAGRTVFAGAFGTQQISNSIHNLKLRYGSDAFARVYWQALQAHAITDDADISKIILAWAVIGIIAACACLGACRLYRTTQMQSILYLAGTLLMIYFSWWVAPIQHARFVWGPLILMIIVAGSLFDAGASLRIASAILGSAIWLVLIVPTFFGSLAGTIPNPMQGGDVRSRALHEPGKKAIGEAWDWVDREVHRCTIAYVGNNVPYFLMGRHFENRVVYVPARRPSLNRFSEFASLSYVSKLGRPNTSEPTIDRYSMDPQAWLENLREMKIDYVFVNTLRSFPMLMVNIRHDAQGFPIERQWLDDLVLRKAARRIELGIGTTRIYQLMIKADTSLRELPIITQEETDALDEIAHLRLRPNEPIPHYPCARDYIQEMKLESLSSK